MSDCFTLRDLERLQKLFDEPYTINEYKELWEWDRRELNKILYEHELLMKVNDGINKKWKE